MKTNPHQGLAPKAQAVKCTRCGHANPVRALACFGCGARLLGASSPRRHQDLITGTAGTPTPKVLTLLPTHKLKSRTKIAKSSPSKARASSTNSSAHVWLTPPPHHPVAECIVCGNANVRRVATVCSPAQWPTTVTNGSLISLAFKHTWGKSHIPPVKGAAPLLEGGKALDSTQLARALAPPQQPTYQQQYSIYVALLLTVLGLLCLPLTLLLRSYSGELANGINIFFFGTALLMFLVSLAESKTAQEDYLLAYQRWQQAMQRWAVLFYCDCCQHVYQPETGQSAPVRNMSSLL